MTTTFRVMIDLPYSSCSVDNSIQEAKDSLSEFGNVSIRTQELVGAAIWVLEIQFEDDNQAVIFKLKYGSEYNPTLMANDDFQSGHQVMFIGG